MGLVKFREPHIVDSEVDTSYCVLEVEEQCGFGEVHRASYCGH